MDPSVTSALNARIREAGAAYGLDRVLPGVPVG
jgi:hypothetical protein